jgi:hypothetical protein
MRPIRSLLLASCLLPLLYACEAPYEGAEAEADEVTPGTSETEVAGADAGDDLSPAEAEARIDDVTLGTALAGDGSIPMDQVTDDFAPGEEVHLAMEVGDTPAGSAIKVVWLGESDARLHDETKTVAVGTHYLSFQVDTDNWALGDYRAEVWIGDERVNTQHFQIVEADKAS